MNKRRLLAFLCHAVIVLAVTNATFYILDIYNPMMGFLTTAYSKTILIALYAASAALGVVGVVRLRRRRR